MMKYVVLAMLSVYGLSFAVYPARLDFQSLKNDFYAPEAKKLAEDEFRGYPFTTLYGACAESGMSDSGSDRSTTNRARASAGESGAILVVRTGWRETDACLLEGDSNLNNCSFHPLRIISDKDLGYDNTDSGGRGTRSESTRSYFAIRKLMRGKLSLVIRHYYFYQSQYSGSTSSSWSTRLTNRFCRFWPGDRGGVE